MKKPIYLFSNKIKYKTFKTVMSKFPAGTIVPENIDRILWELLRDEKIYIFLDTKSDDPVSISLKMPNGKIAIIS
jgi:hypothetical protein